VCRSVVDRLERPRSGPGNACGKVLRQNGIDVVAIQQHMTSTTPTIYFLHYWGTGPAGKLATAFKAALAELGKK
jgi:hypothetical protein